MGGRVERAPRGRGGIPLPHTPPTPGGGWGGEHRVWDEKGPRDRLSSPLTLQDDGELCLNSGQCKSQCCQQDTLLALARCTRKASENSSCSPEVGTGPRAGAGAEPPAGPVSGG